MKTKLSILIFWIFTIILAWCNLQENQQNNLTWDVWLANPASVYCEENGWTLELIFDNGESYGICHFDNGERCEEREYYHWDCFPVSNNTWNKNPNIEPEKTNLNQKSSGEIEDTNTLSKNEEIEIEKNINQTWETIFCKMDAKECPDWSFVSRTWPNCEFAECPWKKENNTQDKTKQDYNKSEETINNWDEEKKTLKQILEDYKNRESHESESLTEDHIDLMEELIEKLK